MVESCRASARALENLMAKKIRSRDIVTLKVGAMAATAAFNLNHAEPLASGTLDAITPYFPGL